MTLTSTQLTNFFRHTKRLDNGCLKWTACGTGRYGLFTVNRKIKSSHRVIYEHKHGKISYDIEIHHKCGFTLCVNIDHLEPVTRKDHGKQTKKVNALKLIFKCGCPRVKENIFMDRGCQGCKIHRNLRSKKSNYKKQKLKLANNTY